MADTSGKTAAPKLSRRQQLLLGKKLAELEAIERELQRRTNSTNPMFYGLPDLMFPQGFAQGTLNHETGEIIREPLPSPETELEYIARQEEAVRDLIETSLHLMKDGRTIDVRLIPKQVQFISDFLFSRSTRGILWKGRGCLTPENLVVTDSGMKPISRVTTSDSVINKDGRFTRVLDAVSRKFSGKIVRIRLAGNLPQPGFTPDHLILAVRPSACVQCGDGQDHLACTSSCMKNCAVRPWKTYHEEWVAAGDLRKGDFVFVPLAPTASETTTPADPAHRWYCEGKVLFRIEDILTEDYDGDVWDIEVAEGSSFCLPYLVAHNCGGSLCAAIMIWLIMLYRRMSFIDLGGSMEQSKVVYEYVSAFWSSVPGLSEILEKDPLISMTKLITGVQLKCIVPGTLVLTDRGIVPVEDIVVGDKILDGEGKFSPVKMTISRRHRGEVVKIVPVGYGRGFETTLDHRTWAMKVATPVRRALQRGEAVDEAPRADWVEAQELEVGDVLPVPKLCTDPSPKTLVLENLRSRKPGPKPLVSIPVTAEFYRLLGYILADGSSHAQLISISFGDHETENIADCVNLVRAVLDRKACVLSRPDVAVKIVHFSFKAFAQWLRDNCGKSDDKKLPLWLLQQATDVELREFVVGAVRGDGGLSASSSALGTKRKMQFTNTSSKLTQAVMLACNRLGLLGGLVLPARRQAIIRGETFDAKQQYIWQITGTACDRIAKMIGHDWDVEKSKSFQQGWHDATHVYRPIKAISRRVYDGPVIDLVIDGHPSFTLPGALVHNCITASEKMARGKHLPGLVADEACQDDVNADNTFKAAMQMSMSEPEHIILLLSTFHHPVGLFQEIWDGAEQKGFKRYAWNVFDVMERCSVGLDRATQDDPDARSFCRNECPLTQNEAVYDENDKLVGTRFIGCDGVARRSRGFLPRDNVINAMVLNEGSEIFKVEFMCKRPQFSGPIYGLEAIENAQVSEITIDDHETTIVGIDWGVTEGVLVLGKDSLHAGPQVLASRYLSVKLVGEYIKILTEWQDEYGHLSIYADSSHPFEIGDLEQAGFEVVPVDFATMKDYGITNLLKMFMYGKIRILDDNTRLVAQLKSYRKDPKTGRPLKINDHGPDALLCMAITIDFTERWADLITSRVAGLARTKLLTTIDELGLDKKASKSEVDENIIDRDNNVMLF
jgi:hypothetical protein